MKKQIKHIFSLMILVSAFTACTSESISEVTSVASQTNGVPFTLKLTNKDKINSRGTYVEKSEEGESKKNENKIKYADIFFYADADADGNADGYAVYKYPYKPENGDEITAEIKGTIPTDVIEVLFESSNKCIAYAVVNGPDTPDSGENDDTSIAALKATEIGATFDTSITEVCFVMDGQSTEITYGNNTVSGSIELFRAAAKIQLYIDELTDYVDDAGNIWSPQNGTDTEFPITVEFYNGTKKSRIDWGDTAISLESADYFDIEDDASRKLTGNDTDGYTHDPFYSYPSSWSSDGSANEACLYLCIYWAKTQEKNSDGTLTDIESPSYEPYYYRVPINLEGDENNGYAACQLTRNTFYKVNINVGVLGNPEKNAGDMSLEPTYTIVNWKTIDIEAELSDYHYLVVEKDYVEVFNENSITIGYTACCENVTATITSITQPYLYNNTIDSYVTTAATNIEAGEKSSVNASNTLLKECIVNVNNENKTITLSHELVNFVSGATNDYDITPYTIKLLVTTACGLQDEIEIIQYPAMYAIVEASATTGSSSSSVAISDYVFIHGNYINASSNTKKNEVTYIKAAHSDVANPNMYIITTTSFADNTYTIGDPRTVNYVANPYTTSYSAPWYYDESVTDWTLKYYRPAEGSTVGASDERTKDMVAPKFRIASSLGLSEDIDYETAVKRCAGYQEDGFPAGRWRLPTRAEIDYVVTLQEMNYIPQLYDPSAHYWSANDADHTTTGRDYLRCVYDEWYWGNDRVLDAEGKPSIFTWGDKETL